MSELVVTRHRVAGLEQKRIGALARVGTALDEVIPAKLVASELPPDCFQADSHVRRGRRINESLKELRGPSRVALGLGLAARSP